MKRLYIISFILLLFSTNSCIGDLDTTPIDPNIVTAEQVYSNPDNYKSVLAKCYAALCLSGQQGPTGDPDLGNFDEGYSSFIRLAFYIQVLTTDEAIMGSQTNGLRQLATNSWDANTAILNGYYARLYQIIGYTNEFLRQTTDEKMNERGHNDPSFRQQVAYFRSEARFLRAYSYWVLLDTYGKVPFVTDADKQDPQFLPQQISRTNLYSYIENELKEIETALPEANEYGRVDKTAANFLLSRLYLNAQVYTNTPQWAKAAEYAEKVINSHYSLSPKYLYNFLADNNTSPEIIWSLNMDGIQAKTYGGTTFFVLAQTGGTMLNYLNMGISGGWGNIRVRPEFVNKFQTSDQDFMPSDPNAFTKNDSRALFFNIGHKKEIAALPGTFQDGYAFTKWRNVDKNGNPGSDAAYVDTDFPMFRLSEAYLTAAEANLRSGKSSEALNYINIIRNRAYNNGNGAISMTDLNLDFILDERSRELSWELVRRTDLIRFNKFTTADYIWSWKGNTQAGKAVDSKYNIFPLPSADITANPNLIQNTGY
ncbi:RagB/SusD family nutrient uptake outer membrane protein [Chryseobacterium sp.]|uniref:RagB/SusD family nutrient uptake outer membrane protein n=1 Tax=Chryseobacterium sp. TaxID=1871047 RepID=UPI0033428BEE